jgi:hypothetical protein
MIVAITLRVMVEAHNLKNNGLVPTIKPAIGQPAFVTRGSIGEGSAGEFVSMLTENCIHQVLRDERITYGLADPEARLLVEWLVTKAETIPETDLQPDDQENAWGLCYRRAKVLRQFVALWCYRGRPEAAIQLAASEGMSDYLPDSSVEEPVDVMLAMMKQEPFAIR